MARRGLVLGSQPIRQTDRGTIMLRALGLFAASTLIAGLAIFTSAKEASATGAVTFFAVLNGLNECDGESPPQCHQGDLNGYGAATILLIPAPVPTVCFGIVVNR